MDGDLNSAEALRDHYGVPSSRAAAKTLTRLDKHCRAIIAKAPFLVLGTATCYAIYQVMTRKKKST